MAEDRPTDHSVIWAFLTITVLPTVATILGKITPESVTTQLPPILTVTVPVPIWAIVVAVLGGLLLLYLSRSRNPVLIAEHQATLQAYKNLSADRVSALDQNIKHLKKEVIRKQAEAMQAVEHLENTRKEFGMLKANCEAARGFYVSMLHNFYPLVIEAGNRIEEAYVSKGRGSREEFRRLFDAGRNIGPRAEGWRAELAFYSGVLGQLVLDVALMAHVAVEMPLGMFDAHTHEPDKGFPELFDEWYENAKTELGEATAEIWSAPQPWAPKLLDHWIDTVDTDVGEENEESEDDIR